MWESLIRNVKKFTFFLTHAMKIHFKLLESSIELGNKMVSWYNDPEIAPFIHVNFNAENPKDYTIEDVQREFIPNINIFKYTIFDDNLPIGELSITRDFFLLQKKNENSAWISIMIGDRNYWGKGVSKLAMIFLEQKCREMGFSRIELGVFENNIKAYNLYINLGYKEFTRIEGLTYSLGKWCADIRLEKYL